MVSAQEKSVQSGLAGLEVGKDDRFETVEEMDSRASK
jgi:hypothetical protein